MKNIVTFLLILIFTLSFSCLALSGSHDFDHIQNRTQIKRALKIFQYSEYISSHADIKKVIEWDEMTIGDKVDIFNIIISLENGESLEPVEDEINKFKKYATLAKKTMKKIYRRRIALSLYLEVNDVVPWKLAKMSDYELKSILSKEVLFNCPTNKIFTNKDEADYMEGVFYSCDVVDNDPLKAYYWAVQNLNTESQAIAIADLIAWARDNLWHYGTTSKLIGDQLIKKTMHNYDVVPEFSEYMNKKATNCHKTGAFFAIILRSLNIPVYIYDYPKPDSHAMVEFPAIGRVLMHADDPYTNHPFHSKIPPLMFAAPHDYFENTVLQLPSPGDWKPGGIEGNTDYYISKYFFILRNFYPTDYYLESTCKYNIEDKAASYGDEGFVEDILYLLDKARKEHGITCADEGIFDSDYF